MFRFGSVLFGSERFGGVRSGSVESHLRDHRGEDLAYPCQGYFVSSPRAPQPPNSAPDSGPNRKLDQQKMDDASQSRMLEEHHRGETNDFIPEDVLPPLGPGIPWGAPGETSLETTRIVEEDLDDTMRLRSASSTSLHDLPPLESHRSS